ncbi:flagellar biosynthetic protein FliO [Stieleria sp. ICT_E10.1]|uniref:FliO/MopB family protein n=1 Tax=Stieleria sedimenti TaxID=2976331 RepID=UPI00217F3896|nr:flagellar biosynthetic protein FliO [Stieleria sedimenti]MCS7467069.1 flagellar biosynthetic protein FliO [Stieleria sedimenti]
MVKPVFRVSVCFAAFVLSHCTAIAHAQSPPQGHSVYRNPVATVPESPPSVERISDTTVDSTTVDAFPALLVSEDAAADDGQAAGGTLAGPVVTTVSSLLVVLAVFGGLVWISRRYGSSRTLAGALPEDVLRNLGSAAIDAKTRVTFLKVGARILVIGQTPSGDPQTLSEITEPDEVARLTNRCLGRPEIVGRRTGYPGGMDRGGVESSRRDLAAG